MSSQEQEITLGSLCVLKSGSPVLTVTKMCEDGDVWVCWFDNEDRHAYAQFPTVCLTPVSEDDGLLTGVF